MVRDRKWEEIHFSFYFKCKIIYKWCFLSDLAVKKSEEGPKICSGYYTGEPNLPLAGTGCAHPCVYEKGKWGSSWCYTRADMSEWGAECIPCSGKESPETYTQNKGL